MNSQVFVLALAIGAGLLALWVEVRFPRLAPAGLVRVFLNIVAALALLHIVDGLLGAIGDHPALRFAVVFATALPALTYVFLSSLWVLRLMQSSMTGSAR
jgi:hypothetical protein